MTMPSLHAEARQQTSLSPRLQRAVRLLQMSSVDFAHELEKAQLENPFLEIENSDASSPSTEADPATSAGGDAMADVPMLPRGGGSVSYGDDDDDTSWLNTMAADSSLAEHLHRQLDVLPLPLRDRVLAKVIVESLDDDGYLRAELDELGALAELVPPAADDEMRIALNHVQSLDPAGVGARNVREVLLLQLESIECASQRELVGRIVAEGFELLAKHDYVGLARRLEQPLDAVERACARLKRLDPRPGWRYGNASMQYVTPDVIVRKQRGVWTTQLNPAVVPRVRLNRVVEALFHRQSRAEHPKLVEHLHEARWTLRNVEQRFATIIDVARAIVERQRMFLDYGAMAMKPLALREIADSVGVHESTVSRVTNNKYMATPRGTFELKYFFSRRMSTASGAQTTPVALRDLVAEMIEHESSDQPLSDAEITRRLAQQGLVIARRTVTKYRQLLRVEPVGRRGRRPI